MPRKKGYPLLYIEWLDHWGTSHGGWLDPGCVRVRPLVCKNVGWQVAEDKHGILVVAGLHSENDEENQEQHSQASYILKGCIVKKKRLG